MKYLGKILDDIYPKSSISKIRDTVRAFVINQNNEIALLHIECNDDFGNRNHYETPGGGVESGESLIDALKREMREEIGYEIENIKEIGYVDIEYNLLNRIDRGYFYVCNTANYIGQELTSEEIDVIKNIEWIKINQIDELYKNRTVSNVGTMIHKRDSLVFKELINLHINKREEF